MVALIASEKPFSDGRHGSHAKSPSTPLKYRADIDGLRALAVLSVVVFHAFPTVVTGGFIGVDIFFVISGVLITGIIVGDLDRHGFAYRTFYARRIKRIFPALIIVLGAALLLGWAVQVNDEFVPMGRHVIGSAAFFENFMLLKEPGYFDTTSELNPLLHLWSLGVEEQFYIIWPIMIGLAWRLRRALAFALILGVAAVSIGISEQWVFIHPMAAFYSPVSRFWELLAGGVLAIVMADKRDFGLHDTVRDAVSFVGLALIGLGLVGIGQETRFPGLWAAVPVMGTCLLIGAGSASWVNRTLLANRYAVWLGLISYPLYLWHWVLLAYARLLFPTALQTPGLLAIVALSCLLAWMTCRWVEKPLRTGRAGAIAIPGLCLGMIAIASIGYAAEHGLNPRLSHTALQADFTRTRVSDGSCATLLGLPATPEEVCQTRSSHPDILIAGDSHAMALNSSVFFSQSALNTVLIGGHSCRLFVSVSQRPVSKQAWGNNCAAITQDVLAAARLPSIKTIVITTHAALAWDSTATDRNDPKTAAIHDPYVFRDAAGQVIDERRADLEGYVGLISALQATGKKLVFVIDVPELKTDPHQCVARLPFLQTRSCDRPESDVARAQRDYRDFVDQLAARFPTMMVFDAAKVLCSPTICAAGDENGSFYFDTHHLSEHGSDKVLGALVAHLDAIQRLDD